MKIVTHKCPNCNANLKIKKGETEGVCEYCQTPYFIDDGVMRVEHKTTVEIKDDNNLEIATATLENFKDYGKSEWLFKGLVYEYGHKKEVYIGIVRSITHDFSITDFESLSRLNEVNEYFRKYKSLATKKEVSEYEGKVNDLNKNFWHKYLISSSSNFNASKSKSKANDIEYYWKQYILYCSKMEQDKLKIKYNDFIKKKRILEKEQSKKKKMIISLIIIAIITIFLIDFISLYTEKPKTNTDSIELSKILENIENKNYNYFEEYLKDTRSDLTIEKASLNEKDKKVELAVNLDNRYHKSNHTVTIKVIDDMGPVITSTNCVYTDTSKVDVNTCFTIFDYTDGVIANENATVEYDEDIFKTDGTKTIKVTATDKDNKTTTKDVKVQITKTPFKMSVKLSKDLYVGETAKLTYTFDPNNIPNKDVELIYDKEYVSIDKNNNVTGLKKGTTNICVKSKYDNSEECISVNVGLKCLNTYTFKFNGGSSETKTAGENFCAGTYKIYGSVLNKSEFYYISVRPKNGALDYMTIYKKDSFFNEEGTKYVFNEGTTFTTEPGITQVKLVKVK